MVESIDTEDKARIDERSNAEDDGQGSEEYCDFGRANEDLSLLPLSTFMNSCKLLPFPNSSVIVKKETLSFSSSFELVKSIVEAGNDGN